MYIGASFNGWQSQADGSAIQDYIEAVLAKIFSQKTRVVGASRTDSGVHAMQQVACFEASAPLDAAKLHASLNALLPTTVAVTAVTAVSPHFHPIFDSLGKAYRYSLWRSRVRNPFLEPFVWPVHPDTDVDLLRAGAACLLGEHDFSSFCAADSGAKTKVRTIHEIDVVDKGDRIDIWFSGNGFLKQMIRAIVGTLVDVGLGKRAPQDLIAILASKDRKQASLTAPARGLTLMAVYYDETPSLDAVKANTSGKQ